MYVISDPSFPLNVDAFQGFSHGHVVSQSILTSERASPTDGPHRSCVLGHLGFIEFNTVKNILCAPDVFLSLALAFPHGMIHIYNRHA